MCIRDRFRFTKPVSRVVLMSMGEVNLRTPFADSRFPRSTETELPRLFLKSTFLWISEATSRSVKNWNQTELLEPVIETVIEKLVASGVTKKVVICLAVERRASFNTCESLVANSISVYLPSGIVITVN